MDLKTKRQAFFLFCQAYLKKTLPPEQAQALIDEHVNLADGSQTPCSINELYFGLLFSAQNTQGKPRQIGGAIQGIENLAKITHDFDPHWVVKHYPDSTAIFQAVVKKLKPTGLVNPMPEVDQAYSQFKDRELTPYLFEVPSQILRNAATQFMTAWQRYIKGLASAPTFKAKGSRDSVILTSELFQFKRRQNGSYRLVLGTPRYPVGVLSFVAPADFAEPKMICLRHKAGRWYVSFNFDDPAIVEPLSREQVLSDLSHLNEEQLESLTFAGDRGVTDLLYGSNGVVFRLSPAEKQKFEKRERRKRNLQRKLSRQQKGSNRSRKTKNKIARVAEKQANVRHNFAHQVSHALVNHTDCRAFTFEDLKIANMVKAPQPKVDDQGRYLPNGARAKAGLNRSILGSCWGQIVMFTDYKAARQNKVVIKVAPQFSSQTCSQCGHTSADNRQKKAFRCIQCGFSVDADFNASLVLQQRGVKYILDGHWQQKKAKKSVSFRKKPGAGLPRISHVEGQSGQTTGAPAKRGNPICNL